MNVSYAAIADYRYVHEHGADHIKAGANSGKLNVTTAARAIRGKSHKEQEGLRTVKQLPAAVEAAPFSSRAEVSLTK
jgi:hypothetical protein